MNSTQNPSELLHFTERGSGPPLLLAHGLMVTGDMFDTVVDQFATRHRVIVPDLRGHGNSRGLPPPYTVSQLALDLSHLLDHLGIPMTAVLGYSQGGAGQCNQETWSRHHLCMSKSPGDALGVCEEPGFRLVPLASFSIES